MDELLSAYFMMDRLGPVLALVVVGAIFAAVRHSERLMPQRKRSDG